MEKIELLLPLARYDCLTSVGFVESHLISGASLTNSWNLIAKYFIARELLTNVSGRDVDDDLACVLQDSYGVFR